MPTVRKLPAVKSSFADLLALAHELADLSAAAILPYFRRKVTVENKGGAGYDPVTEADEAAERVIVR